MPSYNSDTEEEGEDGIWWTTNSLLHHLSVLLLLINGIILSNTQAWVLKAILHFFIFLQPLYLFWLPKQAHIHS